MREILVNVDEQNNKTTAQNEPSNKITMGTFTKIPINPIVI